MALANSRALQLAGITAATPDPPRGKVERRPDGEPTGELKGQAMELVAQLIPPPTAQQAYDELRRIQSLAAANGITSVQNMHELPPNSLAAVERLLAEGQLDFRIYTAVSLDAAPAHIERAREWRDKYRGPLMKFGLVKGVLDGTIDAKTAWMIDPYVGGGTGIPYRIPAEVMQTVAVFDHEGFQIALHAVGDRAIQLALDAYENAARVNGTTRQRHRIEHLDIPLRDTLPRMRQLGVIASSQPNFAYPDPTNIENYAVLLGPERAAHSEAFREIDDAQVVQPFGSDYPVSPMDTLRAIRAAVLRETLDGTPAGGWYPAQKISVAAAVKHFTVDGAFASRDENIKGTLAAGKLADFVVISDDILSGKPVALAKARVLLTVMGGRVTYAATREFE